MRRVIIFSILFITMTACEKKQDSFLNRKPQDILLDEDIWNNKDLILSVIGDLYNRIPFFQNLEDFSDFAMFDEAFPSSSDSYGLVKNNDYDFSLWSNWDYNYIHDINLFLINVKEGSLEDEKLKNRFIAEGRFLRAFAYFDLVKRMGGVPIITDMLNFEFDKGSDDIQLERNKEVEIYEFIIKELDEIAEDLPNDVSIKSRATWGAAKALESRAALYAASIAKYGASTPSVSLAKNIVGIEKELADDFYKKALKAAEEIIESNIYTLFLENPSDLSENFASIFLEKNNNGEVIFAKDYLTRNKTTQFTVQNQPHSSTEEGSWSGWLNPTLNLAQSYEKLDNSYSPFLSHNDNGDFIYYDNVGDIFKDRDARLAGTFILPGSLFRGNEVDIFAGYILENGNVLSGSQYGERKTLPGQNSTTKVVGFDGPIDGLEHGAQTGFYLRKYNNPSPGAGEIGTGSDTWLIYFRFSEILLNAAEASFELGKIDSAANFINLVRRRAGFETDLGKEDVNFDRIVNERRVELAFEGHELWDLKRWRLAHIVWNGKNIDENSILENIGDAKKSQAVSFGLWPYRVYNPGESYDGKWIYKVVKPREVTGRHTFRMGNYYSRISEDVLKNNLNLIQNPNQ